MTDFAPLDIWINRILSCLGLARLQTVNLLRAQIEVLDNDIAALSDTTSALVINSENVCLINNVFEGFEGTAIRFLSTAKYATISGCYFASRSFIASSADDALALSDDTCFYCTQGECDD